MVFCTDNGQKISDLEERASLNGQEAFVFQDEEYNGKVTASTLAEYISTGGGEGGSGLFKAQVSKVNTTIVPEATVSLKSGTFDFTFGLPVGPEGPEGKRGEQGKKGEKGDPGKNGKDGIDAVGGRTVFVYTANPVKPDRPTGGSWDLETNTVYPPEGWYLSSDDLEGTIWLSTGLFGSNGALTGQWSDPIRITGDDGRDGVDGVNVEFIYKLTETDYEKPTVPAESPNTTGYVPDGWTASPSGVTQEMIAEWVCTRSIVDGVWGAWEGPSLWSKYGINGMDGDGVEYIFKLVNTPSPVTKPTKNEQVDDYVPKEEGWTDNPSGVNSEYMWEWVCIRKYIGNTKVWGDWSNPALWAKYGEIGHTGNSIKSMYTITENSSEIPVVVKNNINPGSVWSNFNEDVHTPTGKEALWQIQAEVDYANKLIGEWQGPWLLNGVNGIDGTPVNYKTYVYKKSDVKPAAPTGNDPNNPGDGWQDYPDSEGQWWQCVGNVDGTTQLVTVWGSVVPLNGQDGTAQDGRYYEYRFAKNTSTSAPSLDRSSREPAGWTIEFPSIDPSAGEIMWMTKAFISSENELIGQWDTPVRISGEQGPIGETGPAGAPGADGPQGVSGIPGVSFEMRFCLGTDTTPNGFTPGSAREPYGWSLDTPEVTEQYPYIWFIQARIEYSSNDDDTGSIIGSWSDPATLNGKPGGNGKKGQLVYPAGQYSESTTYETTEDTAPYVYDNNGFYVLNTIMRWNGIEQGRKHPEDSSHWVKFNSFDAIYSNIGVFGQALVGSAVFYEEFIFSQQGIDGSGDVNYDYQNFDSSHIYDGSFCPNFLVNCATGEGHFSAGAIKFNTKSAEIGNINLDSNGDITASGTFKTSSTGQRVELSSTGNAMQIYNSNGVLKGSISYETSTELSTPVLNFNYDANGKKTADININGLEINLTSYTGDSGRTLITPSYIELRKNANTNIHIMNDGNISISGKLTESSDERLKDNIKKLNINLDDIANLDIIRYTLKDTKDDNIFVGSIAQQVENVLPELVSINDDGYKSLAYSKGGFIFAIALAKELKKSNERINKLEKLIIDLQTSK